MSSSQFTSTQPQLTGEEDEEDAREGEEEQLVATPDPFAFRGHFAPSRFASASLPPTESLAFRLNDDSSTVQDSLLRQTK